MSDLAGRTIKEARPMTKAELDAEGWEPTPYDCPLVLVLDDGTKLYPSRDAEGNGPGVLFGIDEQGRSFALMPKPKRSTAGSRKRAVGRRG